MAEKDKEEIIFKIGEQDIPSLPDVKDETKFDAKYPLIDPFANAHIFWDSKNNELIYNVEEPVLNEREKKILGMLEEGIAELINISFLNLKTIDVVIEYLEKNIKVLLSEFGIKLSRESFLKLMYYIYRDFVGLNEIEPLMKDYFIEDIECNGAGTPVYIVHRKYRNLRTNIIYNEAGKLTNFVEKLAQKCGKYISYASPILDGSLPDGSRVNSTYTQEISSRGPTFTIRKFAHIPWSPIKMMQFRTISPELLAYLWILIENEANIMVIGGTGSGKTTLLNTLAFFIPPQARVVSIEDTRELMLLHENWLPSVARTGIGIGEEGKRGEIDLFTLLKESFRQRPDYVIVGEVRGNEAYVLFQGMASIDGNEKIFVLNDNHLKRIKIKDLKNNVKYKAISLDPIKEKSIILPVRKQIIHSARDKLYKIITRRGREVVITPNHSLFTYDNGIRPIFAKNLKINDKVIIPAKIPCNYSNEDYINLIDSLPDIRIFAPDYIKKAVERLGYFKSSKVCNVRSITDYYSNFKRSKPSAIKSNKFLKLMKEAGIKYALKNLKVRFDRKSKTSPAKLKITNEFLRLLGYYISEGSLNLGKKSNRISLYSKNRKILDDMENCINKVIGTKPKRRIVYGFGSSTELSFNHKIIFEFLKNYCGTGSKNRKIPDFIFGLSKKRIGQFLSALYDGDGCFSKNYFGYFTISKELANDVTQLLLVYNIVATIKQRKRRETKDYEILFYKGYEKNNFLKYVNPLKFKKIKIKEFKKNKEYFIDEIKRIKEIRLKKPREVYDISVPGTQSFIGGFGGILLHNSGHPSMGTMHAEDVGTMIRRLETQPINLSPSLVESMDAVCVMGHAKVGGVDVRRLREVDEIISVSGMEGVAKLNTPFIWDPRTDNFYFKTDSKIFDKIVAHKGISRKRLNDEFSVRTRLLLELYKRKIFEYKEVQEVITAYYKNPMQVLKRFGIIK